MRIIPAIDIIDGKCVRLSKGDYSTKKIYHEDPLEVAKEFEAHGLRFLHLVDLDGAKSVDALNYKVLEKIASKTNLKIDFGGGIKSDASIKKAFGSGARQVNIGSIAVADFTRVISWLKIYGPDRIILGADCFNRKIVTHGWTKETEYEVTSLIKKYEAGGIRYCVCTDTSRDGMLQGPAIELYREIISESSVNLIASGGVSSVTNILQLKETGCEGVILGKAIYEGRITLKELSQLC